MPLHSARIRILGVLIASLLSPDIAAAGVFTVTSAADAVPSQPGTLRWAVEQSNATPGGPHRIEFAVAPAGAAGGVKTIAPVAALPDVTAPVTIDGRTQGGPDYAGTPLIELDGSSAGDGVAGLVLAGHDGSAVIGLAVNRFKGDGISIRPGGGGHTISGNLIGTDAAGGDPLPNGGFGLRIDGSAGNTVGPGNVVSANAAGEIRITGAGSRGNAIRGNRVGTDIGGSRSLMAGLNIDALALGDGASGNMIGGTQPGDGNVLGYPHSYYFGNEQYPGVITVRFASLAIRGGSDDNAVLGNRVGVNAPGDALVEEWPGTYDSYAHYRLAGILVEGSRRTRIGAAGAGNLVAGYDSCILVRPGSDSTVIAGNTVGTNAAGDAGFTRPIGHLGQPIRASIMGIIVDGSPHSRIGEAVAGGGNHIAACDFPVMLYSDSSTAFNNLIGLNSAGTAPLARPRSGVPANDEIYHQFWLGGCSGCRVGGPGKYEGNTISGGPSGAIFLGACRANIIQGNRLGTDPSGSLAIANDVGIYLYEADGNTIGGTGPGEGNVIVCSRFGVGSDNWSRDSIRGSNLITGNVITGSPGSASSVGVRLAIGAGPGNTISRNSIYGLGGLGIDRGEETGVDPIRPGGINYPVLSSAIQLPGGTVITGTLSGDAGRTYRIEFFANDAAHPSGHGPGQTYLGSVDATADAGGTASFSFSSATQPSPEAWISAASIDSVTGDTSEFSADIAIVRPGTLSFSSAAYLEAADAGAAEIRVLRSGGSDGTVTVWFSAAAGSAVAGTDFSPASGVLTFGPGQTAKSVAVPLLDNPFAAGPVTVALSLSSPSGGAALSAPSAATLTIVDVGGPRTRFSFSAPAYAADKDAGDVPITVVRTGRTDFAASVAFSAATGPAGSADVAPSYGTLSFSAGETQKTFTVRTLNNAYATGDVAVSLTLGPVSQAAGLGTPSAATLTVRNATAFGPAAVPIPRYRLFLPSAGIHLFTTDPNEYAVLPLLGWVPEGVAHSVFRGPKTGGAVEAVPMWRLFDRTRRDHFWTTDANEYSVLRSRPDLYDDEGVDSYVYPSPVAGTVPLYRLRFGDGSRHLWTTDANEYSVLAGLGWVQEGAIGFVLP
jgi:hypothetical protein